MDQIHCPGHSFRRIERCPEVIHPALGVVRGYVFGCSVLPTGLICFGQFHQRFERIVIDLG
jgi:hypothetical protein